MLTNKHRVKINFGQMALASLAMYIMMTPSAKAFDTQHTKSESVRSERTKSIASNWNLTEEEYSQFVRLKTEGVAAYYWKDLDPVMVLGLSAETETERDYFAEKYARLMRQKVKQELQWERAYQDADKRLFPDKQAIFDRTKLYGKTQLDITTELMEGDQITIFTQINCGSCRTSIKRLMAKATQTHTVTFDIYLVDALDNQSILAWAKASGFPRKLLQTRRVSINQGGAYQDKMQGQPFKLMVRRNGKLYDLDISSFS